MQMEDGNLQIEWQPPETHSTCYISYNVTVTNSQGIAFHQATNLTRITINSSKLAFCDNHTVTVYSLPPDNGVSVNESIPLNLGILW